MTFESYIKDRPVVSFDFDDTLQLTPWDSEKADWAGYDLDNQPLSFPNERIFDILRQYKEKDWKVIIVTTRNDEYMPEVHEFIKKHNLPVEEVHNTNMSWKKNTLKRLNVHTHYDDNKDELRKLKHTKIIGKLVADAQQ